MNYLAHVFLAGPDPERSLGSLVADWLRRGRGGQGGPVSAGIREGITLHMAVDDFVDHHPAFRRSVGRLPAKHRHFRPAMVDVFYDHFLTRHWERFSDVGLRAFLDVHFDGWRRVSETSLPPRVAEGVQRMMKDDVLASYGDLAGVEAAFDRMQWRLRRGALLAGAVESLVGTYAGLEEDFLALWPDVVALGRRGLVAEKLGGAETDG